MDPMTLGMLGMGGLNFLGGLLGSDGGQGKANAYLTNTQASALRQQMGFNLDTWEDRAKAFSLNNLLTQQNIGIAGSQKNLLDTQNLSEKYRMSQRTRMFGKANNMIGQPIFNANANMGLLSQAMQPYQNQMLASLGQRGITGGGALAGALGNLQTQQMAMPLFNALQQNAYATSARDQNLIGMFT